jgi:hypothetical protein
MDEPRNAMLEDAACRLALLLGHTFQIVPGSAAGARAGPSSRRMAEEVCGPILDENERLRDVLGKVQHSDGVPDWVRHEIEMALT